ncbi:MAG: TldD/PmbA family protein [Deltaproteobacteria bacterium]|nr:TldD/PmbA family protein [Deltaproteobacteria bacterium]
MKEKSKVKSQKSEDRGLPPQALSRGQGSETIEGLSKALKNKVDAWEIFYSSQRGLSVEAKDGKVDAFKVSSNEGVGLRVLKNKRIGFSFTSVLSKSSMKELLENAVAASKGVESDEFLSVTSPQQGVGKDLLLFDSSLDKTSEEDKIRKAIGLEQAAKGFDPRVSKVRKASYGESFFESRLINSVGVDVINKATFVSSNIMAVAEERGDSQMGWEMDMSHFAKDVDVVKVGRDAAKRAVGMLGARTIKTVKCPVVIENIIVGEFLEIIAPSFHADNLYKGKSMLKGKKGKKVFSDKVSIWDDGLLPNGWSTSEYDGEGVPRQKTSLAGRGVCLNYLYDTYWAKREGAASTGNAARSNFKSISTIGVSNFYMEKGVKDLNGLLRQMDRGLLLTNVLGAHTANPITGDFSFGADGLWVEGGRISHPVRGTAISGNMLELFSKIEIVGADLRFIGGVGAPSLLISEMEISGSN